MNRPSNVPPWGVPWHGKIESGQLTLPNTDVMPWRQPAGDADYPYEHGATSLIDFGMREADAAPNEEGMQLLNQAILGHGQIHGQEIPAGSWLYQAPDRSVWLVETDLHGELARNRNRVVVSFTRFGVFHGKKESYTAYSSLPVAVLGSLTGSRFRMYHAHPKGKKATFGVFYRGSARPGAMRASQWYELEIYGTPGKGASVYCRIIRTASQTEGVESLEQIRGENSYYIVGGTQTQTLVDTMTSVPPCTGESVLTELPVLRSITKAERDATNKYDRWKVISISGMAQDISSLTGVINGMVYSPNGDLVEITADLSIDTVATAPEIEITDSAPRIRRSENRTGSGSYGPYCYSELTLNQGLSFTAEFTSESSATASITIRSGEDVLSTFSITGSGTYTSTWSRTAIYNGAAESVEHASEYTRTGSLEPGLSGTDASSSGSRTTAITNYTPGIPLDEITPTKAGRMISRAMRWDEMVVISAVIPGIDGSLYYDIYRYANDLFGVRLMELDAGLKGSTFYGELTSPDGSHQLEDESLQGSGLLYGSRNPITNQIARSNDPVSWT